MLPITFFRGFYAESELARLLFSFCFISILLPLYLYHRAKIREITLQVNIWHILAILFFILISISTFISINFTSAIYGSYPLSSQSLIFSLFILILITVLLNFIKGFEDLKTLTVFITAGLLLNALFGIGNYSYRLTSIEAHPIFFGILMMIGMFLSLALRAAVKGHYKTVLSFAALIFFLGMILSLSRGVWISSIFSLLVLLIIFIRSHKLSSLIKHKKFIIYYFFSFLCIGLIFNQPIIERIKPLFAAGTQTSSHYIRYLELKDSLRLALEKSTPFGIGPSQLPFYYPKYRSKELNQTQEWNLYPAQIRNNYLDILIAFGPISLIIFLALQAVVILGALKVLHNLFYLFIFGAWLSLVFHGFFYYYNALTWVLYWFLTAAIISKAKPYTLFHLHFNKYFFKGLFFASCLLSIYSLIFVFKIFTAELAFSEGLKQYNQISYLSNYKKGADNILFVEYNFPKQDKSVLESAIGKFDQAVKESPYENSLYIRQLVYSLTLLGRMQQDSNIKIKLYNTAYQHITEMIQKYPYDYFNFKVRSAITYRILLDKLNDKYTFDQVIDDYRKVSEFDPTDPVNFDNLGLFYRDIGKAEESISMFQESIRLKNNYQPSYIHLGEVYERLEQSEQALRIYQAGLNVFPDNDLLDKKIKELQSKL